MQNATIAYGNAEQVTSFEFYDKKNQTRVTNTKGLVLKQMENLRKIEERLKDVKEKLQKNEQFLKEYDDVIEIW